MATTKIILSEKGFGSTKKGSATVLADKNGKPLNLRLVTLPNGFIGGQVIIIPIEKLTKKEKTFVNTSEEVFEIKVTHQQNVGMVTIRHFNCNDLSFEVYEAGVVFQDGLCKLMSSGGMKDSDLAQDLLEGILSCAWQSGLDRSFDTNPNKIYYGKLAMDGGFTQLQYFDKNKQIV